MIRQDLLNMGFTSEQINMYFKAKKIRKSTLIIKDGKKVKDFIVEEYYDNDEVNRIINHLKKYTVINIWGLRC